jgi:hypothetical protein
MRIPLRLQPVLIALTLLNLGILGVIIAREQAVAAPALTSDGILRGRGLQIVDDQGKVRASITINPAVKQPDGSTYLETVLLRMITSEGRPVVNLHPRMGPAWRCQRPRGSPMCKFWRAAAIQNSSSSMAPAKRL